MCKLGFYNYGIKNSKNFEITPITTNVSPQATRTTQSEHIEDFDKTNLSNPNLEEGFVSSKKTNREKVFFVHAVSVGETKSALSLVKRIREEFPKATIYFSTTTETGQQEAKRLLSETVDFFLFLPIDLSFIISKFFKKIKPDVVIFVETDFWYNFFKYTKKMGALLFVVSGKISEKSFLRFQKANKIFSSKLLKSKFYKTFTDRLFNYVDFFCVQDEIYLERFLKLGVSKDKIAITGNLKFSISLHSASLHSASLHSARLQPNVQLASNDPNDNNSKSKNNENDVDERNIFITITVASTHDPEERLILQKFLPFLNDKNLKIKIFLAPRHPERSKSVIALLEKENIQYQVLSELENKNNSKNNENNKNDANESFSSSRSARSARSARPARSDNSMSSVVLIDSIGRLNSCFAESDLAIVGGSFVKNVGGHNILEPIFFSVPVIFGPFMKNQEELRRIALKYNCGIEVPIETLGFTIKHFFENHSKNYSKKSYFEDSFRENEELESELSNVLASSDNEQPLKLSEFFKKFDENRRRLIDDLVEEGSDFTSEKAVNSIPNFGKNVERTFDKIFNFLVRS